MEWFSMAQKYVDDITESIVHQANEVQAQMAVEEMKVREELAKSNPNLVGEAHLPWETSEDSLAILSSAVMEKILSLSLTEQNFSVAPPKLEAMQFNFTEHIPTAMRLLSLDANLARMHSKLSPKMDEVVFWHHYFFRVMYIRLTLGIEKVGTNAAFTIMKALPEDDVIYKPTFVPPPQIKPAHEKFSPMVSPDRSKSVNDTSLSDRKNSPAVLKETETEADNISEDPEEKERQISMESRRIAEAALAAEVEAELDDDIDLTDLGDLDLDDDTDDFDYVGDLQDDEELEAQIALELAKESEKDKKHEK